MPKVYVCANWKCGRCKKVNRTSGSKCAGCGESKTKGTSLDTLPGDWICSSCRTNNFARKVNCYKCKKPK